MDTGIRSMGILSLRSRSSNEWGSGFLSSSVGTPSVASRINKFLSWISSCFSEKTCRNILAMGVAPSIDRENSADDWSITWWTRLTWRLLLEYFDQFRRVLDIVNGWSIEEINVDTIRIETRSEIDDDRNDSSQFVPWQEKHRKMDFRSPTNKRNSNRTSCGRWFRPTVDNVVWTKQSNISVCWTMKHHFERTERCIHRARIVADENKLVTFEQTQFHGEIGTNFNEKMSEHYALMVVDHRHIDFHISRQVWQNRSFDQCCCVVDS